ncbi:MAG TPA: glycosyltransferase, partial [Allocoleopsis sp.]
TLCDALLQLPVDRPWKWLLLGRGELKQTILDRANTAGIANRLIWVESVPHAEVANYINVMSTLVLPSQSTEQFKTLTSVGWKEQFGHVLIEAMACQVPVIGSDSGEIPHVIHDAGLIFPEGNSQALKDCLLRLMQHPEVAIEWSKKGYQRAIETYTNKALAKQQLAFYKQLLKA